MPGQHRGLDNGDDSTSFGAEHGKAENAIALRFDKRLHETNGFCSGARAEDRDDGESGSADGGSLALGLVLAQSDPPKWWVCEHTTGDQPAAGTALTTSEIVANDPEIVEGDMSELRTALAVADRPDIRGGGLKPVVDTDNARPSGSTAAMSRPIPC